MGRGEGWSPNSRDLTGSLPFNYPVKIIEILVMTSDHEFYPHMKDKKGVKDTPDK